MVVGEGYRLPKRVVRERAKTPADTIAFSLGALNIKTMPLTNATKHAT